MDAGGKLRVVVEAISSLENIGAGNIRDRGNC